MIAGDRALRRMTVPGRVVAAAIAVTFVAGYAAGIVTPQFVHARAAATQSGVAAATSWVGSEAYLAYRADERADLAMTPTAAALAWLDYRKGERTDLVITPAAAARAWLDYRRGERDPSR